MNSVRLGRLIISRRSSSSNERGDARERLRCRRAHQGRRHWTPRSEVGSNVHQLLMPLEEGGRRLQSARRIQPRARLAHEQNGRGWVRAGALALTMDILFSLPRREDFKALPVEAKGCKCHPCQAARAQQGAKARDRAVSRPRAPRASSESTWSAKFRSNRYNTLQFVQLIQLQVTVPKPRCNVCSERREKSGSILDTRYRATNVSG